MLVARIPLGFRISWFAHRARFGRVRCVHTKQNPTDGHAASKPLSFRKMPSVPLYHSMSLVGVQFFDTETWESIRQQYGDVVKIRGPYGFTQVHLFNPKDFETVIAAEGDIPHSSSHFRCTELYQWYKNQFNIVEGLEEHTGEHWKRLHDAVMKKWDTSKPENKDVQQEQFTAIQSILPELMYSLEVALTQNDTRFLPASEVQLQLGIFVAEVVIAALFGIRFGGLSKPPLTAKYRRYFAVDDFHTRNRTAATDLVNQIFRVNGVEKQNVRFGFNVNSASKGKEGGAPIEPNKAPPQLGRYLFRPPDPTERFHYKNVYSRHYGDIYDTIRMLIEFKQREYAQLLPKKPFLLQAYEKVLQLAAGGGGLHGDKGGQRSRSPALIKYLARKSQPKVDDSSSSQQQPSSLLTGGSEDDTEQRMLPPPSTAAGGTSIQFLPFTSEDIITTAEMTAPLPPPPPSTTDSDAPLSSSSNSQGSSTEWWKTPVADNSAVVAQPSSSSLSSPSTSSTSQQQSSSPPPQVSGPSPPPPSLSADSPSFPRKSSKEEATAHECGVVTISDLNAELRQRQKRQQQQQQQRRKRQNEIQEGGVSKSSQSDQEKGGSGGGSDLPHPLFKKGQLDSFIRYLLLDSGLHDEEIQEICTEMLVNSVEHLVWTLWWAIYDFSTQPHFQDACRAEIFQVFDVNLFPKSPSDLQHAQLPKLVQFVRESQRIHTLHQTLTRRLNQAVVVGGYEVPAGTDFVFHLAAVARDGRFYKRPGTFTPTRWEGIYRGSRGGSSSCPHTTATTSGDRSTEPGEFHPCAYLPYGAGPRECPGMELAEHLLLATLSSLLRRYEMVWPFRLHPNDSFQYNEDSLLRVPDRTTLSTARMGLLRLKFSPTALLDRGAAVPHQQRLSSPGQSSSSSSSSNPTKEN